MGHRLHIGLGLGFRVTKPLGLGLGLGGVPPGEGFRGGLGCPWPRGLGEYNDEALTVRNPDDPTRPKCSSFEL